MHVRSGCHYRLPANSQPFSPLSFAKSFPQTAAEIGQALLDPFVLPFEVASALLVVAMIGAILIVQEEE